MLNLGVALFSMQMSDQALDHHAPHLSELTSCGAQSVKEIPNYAGMLRFNRAIMQMGYIDEYQGLVWNFIDRLEVVIREYNSGVKHLRKYVGALPGAHMPKVYREALSEFETAILQMHIAVGLLDGMAARISDRESDPKHKIPRLMQRDTPYDRLRLLSNNIKHFDGAVDRVIKRNEPVLRAPLWLTNDGFAACVAPQEKDHTFSVNLPFSEMEQIIADQSTDAERLANTLPQQVYGARQKDG